MAKRRELRERGESLLKEIDAPVHVPDPRIQAPTNPLDSDWKMEASLYFGTGGVLGLPEKVQILADQKLNGLKQSKKTAGNSSWLSLVGENAQEREERLIVCLKPFPDAH